MDRSNVYHRGMPAQRHTRAFSLIELIAAIILISILLALFIPAMHLARSVSQREQCAENLARLGSALHHYLEDNNHQFPTVLDQPSWRYGGVRFSAADGTPFLDTNRPLNQFLIYHHAAANAFCCPADIGITGEIPEIGTGTRSACRAFGTSYRANPSLFDSRIAGIPGKGRGLYRNEIITAPSRMLVLGDAIWYEVAESTGRNANWHQQPDTGNILFLDNSVRFQSVNPRGISGPVVLDPFPSAIQPTNNTADSPNPASPMPPTSK